MSFSKLLLTPKYWPIALGLGIVRVLSFIPLPILDSLGCWIGRVAFKYAKHRRHVTLRNLTVCFPHLSEAEVLALGKKNFEAAGAAIFEVAYAWLASDARVTPLFRYEGLEHLQAAEADGRGILLLTAHACCLELGARAMTLKTPFHAMYRPHKNAYFDAWQHRLREKQSRREPIDRNNIRGTLRLLKKGEKLWYAPDQNYGGSEHVFVPFFGVNALTITATSKLSRVANAQVLPYYVFKKKDEKGKTYYLVRIYPVLADFPTNDMVQDCTRLNQLFEGWINEHPEQYLWAHRRFKSRPEGEPSIY